MEPEEKNKPNKLEDKLEDPPILGFDFCFGNIRLKEIVFEARVGKYGCPAEVIIRFKQPKEAIIIEPQDLKKP